MNIKILKVGPVGDIEMEETFELSFVVPPKRELINGVLHEPMKQNRFILEIGNFVYTINPDDGQLYELTHLRKEENYEN